MSRPLVLRWATALAGLVFIGDVLTPAGIAVGILYSPVIFLSLWSGRRRLVVIVTAICTALTLVAALLKPVGQNPTLMIGNRLLSIVVLWALAVITMRLQASVYFSVAHAGSSLAIPQGSAFQRSPEEDRLRALSVHLQATHEGERRRLARAIHDHLGQGLTALKIDLSWLREKLTADQPVFSKIEAMLGHLNETVQNVRRLETALRPAILDDFGLSAALEWHIDQFQKRTAIPCEVQIREDFEVAPELSIQLFRVFEEILSLSAQRGAAAVSVSLQTQGRDLLLGVRNTGAAIEEHDLPDSQAIGLTSVRERLRPLGGELTLSGGEPEGTLVLVRVPVDR